MAVGPAVDPPGTEYAPSGLRLDPIVRVDVPDQWVEMVTSEDDVFYINLARNQHSTVDPRVATSNVI
jgi:hypothetical protein